MKTEFNRAAMLMAPLLATTAWAQPVPMAADGAGDTLDEIIVTAQRRAEPLQEVPIAANVVSAAFLESAGVTDMTQLSAVVPGLAITHTAGTFSPAIRGIRSSSNVVENAVALYIDNVYMVNAREGLRDIGNVEQITVLKGPQGTLFGRNATGGVIQMTTPAPSHDAKGEVKLSYNNYETVKGSAYLTGGLADNLAVSLYSSYEDQGEGWGKSVINGMDTYQLRHSLSLRGKALFEPTDVTKATLIVDYLDREDSGRVYQPYPGTTYSVPGFGPVDSRYDTYSVTPAWNKFKSRGASLELTHEFDSVELVSISAYRRGTGGFRFDFLGLERPYIVSTGDLRNESFSQELQFISHNDGWFQWMAGAFYLDSNIEYADFPRVVTQPFTPLPTTSRIDGQAKEFTSSVAPFAQFDIKLSADTTLTAGGRWTYEERKIKGFQKITLVSGAVITNNVPAKNILKTKEPTWRVALKHDLTSDVSAYVSYNRGIKSGGFNIATPQSVPYLTEKLDAYETGLKAQFFDRKLTFNSSAFYYDYSNVQVQTFIGGPTPITTNGAKAEMYGIDGDLQAKLSRDLSLSGGFQVMSAKFTDYPGAPLARPNPAGGTIIGSGSADGKRLPLAQKFVASLALDYEREIGDVVAHFNVNGTRNGDYVFEPSNFTRQPAYTMLNASVKLSNPDDTLSLTLAATNILNKSIITDISAQTYAYFVAYGGAPRVFAVTAAAKF